jgi:hypothetical protein
MQLSAARFIVAFAVFLSAILTAVQPTLAQQRMFGAVSTATNQVVTNPNGQQLYVTGGGQAVPLPGNGVNGTQVQIYTGMMGKQWYVDRTGNRVYLTVPAPAIPMGAVQQPTIINNNAAPISPGVLPVPIPIPTTGFARPYGAAPININAPVNITPYPGTYPGGTYPVSSMPTSSMPANTMPTNTMPANTMPASSMSAAQNTTGFGRRHLATPATAATAAPRGTAGSAAARISPATTAAATKRRWRN